MPPLDAWWLTLASLVAFLAWLSLPCTASLLLRMLAFLIGHKLLALFWLFEAVAIAGEKPVLSVPVAGLGLFPIVMHALTRAFIICIGMQLVHGRWCFAGDVSVSGRVKGSELVIIVPCLWGIYEWTMTQGYFGGLPMGFLGQSQLQGPLSVLVPVVGTIGLSVLVMSLCGSVAWALTTLSGSIISIVRRLLPGFCIALAAALLDGIAQTTPDEDPRKAVVMTAQFDPRAKRAAESVILPVAKALDDRDLGKTDILFLPETTFTEGITDSERTLMGAAFDKAFDDVPMLVGFHYETNGRKYNAVGTLSEPHAIYRKRHLVPIYEYLPWSGLTARWHSFFGADKDFDAGPDQQAPVIVGGNPVAVAICFEADFPALLTDSLKQAGLLFVASSDSWSSSIQGRAQMLQVAQARAMEFGRPVVRSAVNGVSAVIDQHGQIRQQSQSNEKEIVEDVYPTRGTTPFAFIGQGGIVAALFLVVCTMLLRVRGKAGAGWPGRRVA